MHIVKPYQTAVCLFNAAGLVQSFPSKKAAYKALGYSWIADNVGEHFREFSHHIAVLTGEGTWVREAVYKSYAYVLRNDHGEPLTAGDFYEFTRKAVAKASHRWSSFYQFWNGEGPVPHVHKRGHYRYFRRVHTAPLRRDAVRPRDALEPPIRAKRSARSLPTSWDDIPRSDVEDRSWKRHRKTQWK